MDEQNPITPPEYVPIPAQIAMSGKPDLIGHYNGLRAMAWRYDFSHTDPLPANQFWNALKLGKSRFYDVLKLLEAEGWIKRNVPYPGGLQIWFPVQFIGQSDISDETVKLISSYNNDLLNLTSPVNRTVQFIGLVKDLSGLGVHIALAEYFAKSKPAPQVYAAIEIYQWAIENRVAKSPGYLVRFLQENWVAPAGFVPPGWRCGECKQRKDQHAPGCPSKLSLWDDENDNAQVDIETLCPTCGETNQHAETCWRNQKVME